MPEFVSNVPKRVNSELLIKETLGNLNGYVESELVVLCHDVVHTER